uniref:DB domain-containing protein n=1 Tax=Caenorhabditis japonica TaxID=281687 RepID=A0A8R1DW16_CAEJA
MFNKKNKCPIEAVNEIHYCAAQGIDHTSCCEANGVSATAAGAKCLAFCDQRPNVFTPVDATFLPCYQVFEDAALKRSSNPLKILRI